jgi:hypothetical protein
MVHAVIRIEDDRLDDSGFVAQQIGILALQIEKEEGANFLFPLSNFGVLG